MRLARPKDWARDNWVSFDKYRALDGVRTVQATLTGLDLANRTVLGTAPDGSPVAETYDVLVVSTGVRNGFWPAHLQTPEEIAADLTATHDRLGAAGSVIIIGGGAAAVSAAANIATAWPGKKVDLYFADRALTEHHPRVWEKLQGKLIGLGVVLHPGHRAVLPDGFDGDAITDAPVQWSTGQRLRRPTRCYGRSDESRPTPSGCHRNCLMSRAS